MITNPLSKRRQLNVQEQNQLTEHSIREHVRYWRENSLPVALICTGQARGIDWSRSIVLELEIDFPGMPRLFGLLLSQDERFIQFEIDTDEQHRVPISVDEWDDVTDRHNTNLHNRGIGAGYGALALKVFHEFVGGLSRDEDM